MAQPRSRIVSLEATPYYHCITRCVRRAFLCGKGRFTGKSFNHRKPWFIKRLTLLSEAFAIDIASFAIMSNYYHLVLHVDQVRSRTWTQDEIIERWLKIYKGPELIHLYLKGELTSTTELEKVTELTELW